MVRSDVSRIGIFPCVRPIGSHPLGYCVGIAEIDVVSLSPSTLFWRNVAVIDENIDTVWLETGHFRGDSADSVCLADICRNSDIDNKILNQYNIFDFEVE